MTALFRLDAEADRLRGAGRYERTLHTKAGEVTLKVPKLRRQTFETAIIERHRRRESSVEEALIEMYLAGVPVRRVEDITEALWGTRVSPGTVSKLNQKIYAKIEVWRNRPIEGDHPYLYLDGIVMKRRWAGEVRNVLLLVASAETAFSNGMSAGPSPGRGMRSCNVVGIEARHGMARCLVLKGGCLYPAPIAAFRTTRVETAARWRINRARHVTDDTCPFRLFFGIGPGYRRDQSPRVGMHGTAEQGLGRCQLDDLPEVHDGDAIADVPHDAEVVRDEDVGQTEPLL